jgi:hypothetical protein
MPDAGCGAIGLIELIGLRGIGIAHSVQIKIGVRVRALSVPADSS